MPCSLHGNAWQRVASKGHESIVTCSASRPPLRCMYHELPSTSQFCRSNLPRSPPIHCILNLRRHSCLLCPRLGVLSSCPRQAETTHPHPKRSIPCMYLPILLRYFSESCIAVKCKLSFPSACHVMPSKCCPSASALRLTHGKQLSPPATSYQPSSSTHCSLNSHS